MTERDDQILAAEFVLGLLDPETHADGGAAHRIRRGLRREVAHWRERFADLDDTAEPVVPAGRTVAAGSKRAWARRSPRHGSRCRPALAALEQPGGAADRGRCPGSTAALAFAIVTGVA